MCVYLLCCMNLHAYDYIVRHSSPHNEAFAAARRNFSGHPDASQKMRQLRGPAVGAQRWVTSKIA